MRIAVIGENGTAKALRGLLSSSGQYALTDRRGQFTVVIHEQPSSTVTIDGVDSALESRIVSRVAELVPGGRVELQRGGGNQDDRTIVIITPAGSPAHSKAVELGVFRALEQIRGARTLRWWHTFLPILFLLTASPSAQFFTTAVRTVQDEGSVLPSRPTVNMIGTAVSCVDNAASGRTDCTFSGGGGGAPTTAQYWVGASDATLSAEKDLSALSSISAAGAGGLAAGSIAATIVAE